MCAHPDDNEAKYRGICKDCKEIKCKKWREIPDHNHRMLKVHILTPEYEKWEKDIKDFFEETRWTRMYIKDDRIIYEYEPLCYADLLAMSEEERKVHDENILRYETSMWPKMCSCCMH